MKLSETRKQSIKAVRKKYDMRRPLRDGKTFSGLVQLLAYAYEKHGNDEAVYEVIMFVCDRYLEHAKRPANEVFFRLVADWAYVADCLPTKGDALARPSHRVDMDKLIDYIGKEHFVEFMMTWCGFWNERRVIHDTPLPMTSIAINDGQYIESKRLMYL